MDLWPTVAATASIVALLAILATRMGQAPADDRRRWRTVLLGAAGLVVAVGLIAFVWTLTQPI